LQVLVIVSIRIFYLVHLNFVKQDIPQLKTAIPLHD